MLGQSLVALTRASRWIFPLLAVLIILPGLPFTPKVMDALQHIVGLGLTAAAAWLVILCIEIFSDIIAGRYRIDVKDNLTARRIQTQFKMLHRIVCAGRNRYVGHHAHDLSGHPAHRRKRSPSAGLAS